MTSRLAARGVLAAALVTPWVEAELLGLRQLVRPGAVCVDVGAAAGIYTAVLAHLAGPGGQVHSVEPLPYAHRRFGRVLRAAPNVQRHPVAFGAAPTTAALHVPMGRRGLVTGRSYLAVGARGPGSNAEFRGHVATTVQVETLDRLCRRVPVDRLDFVKIDVEGAELQVLQGAAEVIDRFRPTLLVEIEARHARRYGTDPEQVVGWLRRQGYSPARWTGAGWRPAAHVHPSVRNYLFRPESEPWVPALAAIDAAAG